LAKIGAAIGLEESIAACSVALSEARVISRTTWTLSLKVTMATEVGGAQLVHEIVQRVLHEVEAAGPRPSTRRCR
jgi:hypothetical protein